MVKVTSTQNRGPVSTQEVGGLRKQPTQKRSRDRVDAILKATAELLDEQGLAALTTAMIAERAGTTVSSLYQFFAHVDAIITELVREWTRGFEAIVDATDELAKLSPTESMDRIVDDYVTFLRDTPGFGAVYFGARLRGEARSLDRASNALLSDRLVEIWAKRYGVSVDDTMRALARVTIHIGDALLALAFRQNARGDEATIVQAKRAINLYLADGLKPYEDAAGR